MSLEWASFIILVDAPVVPPGDLARHWVATDVPLHYLWWERVDTAGPEGPPQVLDVPELQAVNAQSIRGKLPDGTLWGPFDEPAYEAFRPLGNYLGGQATDHLDCQDLAGTEQAQRGDPQADNQIERLYPADNIPFAIEVRHKYFDGNANPAWDGYGWRAEFVGPAGQRDPSARAIGIYNDPEATNYWYTTGAFTQQESEWQEDGQGGFLMVWATEYNDALLTGTGKPDPADVHHAVLLGAAQEGYQTLRADQESATHLYWETDQSGAQRSSGAGGWVDTGAVIVGHVGTLYRVGPANATDDWVPGDKLRINGHETTFVEKWNGQADLIKCLPHIHVSLVPVGSMIERWR